MPLVHGHVLSGGPRQRWRVWSLVGTAAAVLLLGACSTGAGTPGGSSTPGTSSASSSGGMLAYSQCMRAQGVAGFPDPNAQGKIDLGSNQKFDPNSAIFQAADAKCKKLLPDNGNVAAPPVSGDAQINYAKCMRTNGVPNFPDPNAQGGIDINGASLGVDPNGPIFKAADGKCNHFLVQAAGGAPKIQSTGSP